MKQDNCVYPFGLDPKWYVASNELTFMNSLKMKISVIFGVGQMTLGIVLKGLNAIYFEKKLDLIFEFIPQLIFMSLLFGYMCIMIIIKWSIDWTQSTTPPPSIITLLMNIFLGGGTVEGKPLYGEEGSQEALHKAILIIALLCVPLMLLPKPLILHFGRKQNEHKGEYDAMIEAEGEQHHEEDESFMEIFIHQVIETIEFVLGAISNTASYLRLWALSLAHAQLAKVFFEKCLLGMIQEGSAIMIIIGYFLFANVTFGVLMCMDQLECFLHTLRLHWVEFQNKFYKADGYRFTPFSFRINFESFENSPQANPNN